jgi:hypothetical protein
MERQKDADGNMIDERFAHLNVINANLLDALAPSGYSPTVRGATLFGANLRDLGLSDGPHTHSVARPTNGGHLTEFIKTLYENQ